MIQSEAALGARPSAGGSLRGGGKKNSQHDIFTQNSADTKFNVYIYKYICILKRRITPTEAASRNIPRINRSEEQILPESHLIGIILSAKQNKTISPLPVWHCAPLQSRIPSVRPLSDYTAGTRRHTNKRTSRGQAVCMCVRARVYVSVCVCVCCFFLTNRDRI